jgi:hypothetical protein
MPNAAQAMNEAERVRDEMHEMLAELDQVRKAFAAGTATAEDVDAVQEKTHDATERYFVALRKALGTAEAA